MTIEEAIKILNEEKDFQNTLADKSVFNAICIAVEALKQTERPTARWERIMDYNKCSNCGKLIIYYYDYKYCPACGARMTESEDKE